MHPTLCGVGPRPPCLTYTLNSYIPSSGLGLGVFKVMFSPNIQVMSFVLRTFCCYSMVIFSLRQLLTPHFFEM